MCEIQCKSCSCNQADQKWTVTEMNNSQSKLPNNTVLYWPSQSVGSTTQVPDAQRAVFTTQLCGDTLLIDTLGWIRAVFGDPSKPQRPKKNPQTQMSVFLGTWTITGSTPCNNQGLNIYRDCVLNKPAIKYFLFKPSRCVLLNARQVTPLACRTYICLL